MQNKIIEGFRLSPRQKQLWRAQRNSPAYRAQCLISLAGDLRPEVLGKALRAVVQRHEILRTTFEHLPSMDVPLQVIADTADLSYDEASSGDFKQEGELPFVFERGPLVRFKLLKRSAAEHALLINLPALCADARTLKNLVSEISREYEAAQSEATRGDDEQVIQYAQYSEWLNEINADEAAEAGKAYWAEQQLSTVSLPFETEPLDPFSPACLVENVDANLVARIDETSAKQNISVEVFLLACWQVLLWKLTGQTDLVVETLFDGRKYEELNGALGLFASYLPVRAHIDENFRFAEVLQKVNSVVNDASAQQEYFTREQSSDSTSIKFDYEERPADEERGGLRFSLDQQYVCLERSKLRLSAVAHRNSLALEFHFDQSVYRPDTIQRLAEEFITLLESAVSRPNIPVGELNALGESELRYLLTGLNDTRAAYREDICLHQLFENQVELTSSATAVVYEDSSLTFAELNAKANQLAHYLRTLGVGPDARVGICMERSTAMLVAVMGVLKAGGAYLPLDPAYPQERIAFLLNDAQAKVLLSQESLMATLPQHDGQTVYFDRDREAIARESEQNPLNLTTPDHIAYVIYTSGSTGQPKGVMVRHGAVLNLITALDQAIYSRHQSPLRISMNAPLSFDASVKQLVQIARGQTLYIVPDEIRPDSDAMLVFIKKHQLDVLDCTPTQLKLLLDAGMHSKPDSSPSFVLVGGEAVDDALWVELANSPTTIYYDVYGPTECTVDATCCRIGPELKNPTIGRPLANVQIYLLDQQQRPVLFGVTGELCIGGAGLARGYLNRSELTAEKFVPHPFSDEPGARLYRTGDLARYRADGTIEFAGRADHQVKLRGLRIELGEIESVIKQHPAVSDAVVLVREDVPGDQRLISYLVTKRKYASVIEGRTRHHLPNGMAIVNHNSTETNYIYQEIFEDHIYLKYGVKLNKGACVFDVGANIGLFTLFVSQHCEDARIYAFEPLGPIFDSLRINSELYAGNVKLFKHGLADEEGLQTFTYYPNYSARSGVSKYADALDEVDVIKKFLQNKQESGDANLSGLLDEADDVLTGFFQSEAHECRLRRLSDVMREQGIEHIDLLKVDVQRSEFDVLKGVADEDWEKIDQVAMEVHDGEGQDTEGRVGEILHLLNRHGFFAIAEQDDLLKQTDRYNLYAVRRSSRSDDDPYLGHVISIQSGDTIYDVRDGIAPFTSFSASVKQNRIERIDLLKVNTEGDGFDLLMSLNENDWSRIRQIVVEVPGAGHLVKVAPLLTKHGFHIVIEQTPLVNGAGVYWVHGTKDRKENVSRNGDGQSRVETFSTVSAGELRDYVRERLPDYMMPAAFILLDELPLSRNGKVDRRALPAPDRVEGRNSDQVRSAATWYEELLIELWAEILHVGEVSTDANFFELGGHSLLATQLISRIREAFSVELPLRTLFEEPTVAGLAKRIEKARAQGLEERAEIVRVERTERMPLSFAQQRLWFLNQLEPDSSFYNCPGSIRLTGKLDAIAFDRTLNEVVRRHEILRTSFPTIDGQPVQSIAPVQTIELPIIDLTELPEDERELETQRLTTEEMLRPFDLVNGPMLRVTLLRLTEQEHVVLFTTHHIISDGWSMGVLVKEVSALYAAFSRGESSPLPELAVQYADFAVWQREWLQGEALEEQLSYWREQLQGAPPILELPSDRPRPAVQTYRGASHPFRISPEVSAGLKALGRREGATLFMTLLAAFKVLLSRYSGQADISVGTDMAGRNRAEIEPLIGFFINALVMRTEVRPEEGFRELLKRVREVCLGAYAHQDVPFEKLVEELNPERSLSHSPLFQVSFSLNNAGHEGLQLNELTLGPVGVNRETAKFDLTLSMLEGATRLVGVMEYSTDLFDEATIARMTGHFQQLLESIVTHPDLRCSQLPLLSEAETAQQLTAMNDTAVDYPRDLALHQLFEAQAAATPASVAVVSEAEQISYGDLNKRANQLAHYLRELGVGPESLIGICCERSIEMMVAVLGVLKAGAAYVPLDPEYPAARLAGMMEDASISVLLTQEKLLDVLPPYDGKVISSDESYRTYSHENLNNIATPQNTAYVIYTSGSTGRPKGVMVAHQSLVNFTLMMAQQLELSASDRILQFASLSFDVFTEEVFPVWSRGGAVVLMGSQWVATGAEFTGLLERQAVTGCELPAAFWHEWVRELAETGATPPESLRFLIVGCEKPLPERVAQWQSFEAGQLWRVFGLTETSITTTMYRGSDSFDLPIGKPVANTEVYVLDGELQPVPLGVAGELYIGGDGLARGYWGRPEQTAERFVPHPFSAEAGARLYKTGDLVRYQADGNLEFIGRGDEQVKVRGFRIELGEIESVLSTHAAVSECAVAVFGRADDKRLVAYVMSDETEPLNSNHLRAYLKERLPEYMVPSVFVTVSELPLTPNGKVDRKALPEPERNAAEAGYVAARTPVEEVLSGIWAQVLKTEQVGIQSNFFDLGGHSLLATQVISRIRETFSVELPLRVIFESPTVAELALRVETALHAGQGLETLPLQAVEREGDLPLSFAQERLWFLDQLEPESAFYNIPSGVRLSGELDVAALERTLTEVVRRHEVLRTTFPMVAGVPVQRVAAAEPFHFPVFDLSTQPEPERLPEARRVAIEESRRPFDLAQGPMLRGMLLKLADDDHIVLLTMHHVISDAWSTGVLIREVATLYGAFVRGEASPLEELPIQYADFAVWQREWLRDEVLERQLAYWREQLQGAPPVLDFPIDHPRPAVQSYRGALHLFVLPDELTKQLKTLTRRGEATLFMTLLAGFQILLHRYTNMDDIVVGTPIAGRNRMEMENLIGFFINSLTLRTRFSGQMSFLDVLKQVREVTLGAYANQDVPFEKLVEELQPERDLSRQPLFQIVFSLQNAPLEDSDLPGITMTSFAPGDAGARFEITLDMTEFGERLGGALRYNVDLFDESTIKRLAEHYVRLLEAVVLDPQQAISELSLLSEAERHQQLFLWNDTSVSYPSQIPVHRIFELRAAASPLALALNGDNVEITYGDLNQRANRLARYLRRLGVGYEDRVGICLPRSIEMVVAMLGVLKAGAVYVPLDPQYPLERLALMVEDAQAVVVVTNEEEASSLPSQWAQIVMVDSDKEVIEKENGDDLSVTEPEYREVEGDGLAYIMYTSGSTGIPKGVAVTHKGITRLVSNTNYVALGASTRVAHLSNTAFDASTFEVWASLLNGGQSIIISRDTALSSQALAAEIKQHNISTMFLTTALFNRIVKEVPDAFNSARDVLVGGEAVDVHSVRTVLAAGGPQRLLNAYGPTESTTFTTWYEIGDLSESATTIAIGQPISNTQVYVLDAEMRPVAVGVTGELYIGGDGLARGYWRRPEQTAERFVPNPFGSGTGERLYRTGDLVRYRPGGNIEFIGRRDAQVKLRGFRIEPGEIESVLGAHSSLRDCFVTVIGEADDKKLVAYVVGHEAVDAGVLRAYLKDRLPEYMVPSAFVTLEEIPLTPNGKVDRKALPEPGQGSGEADLRYEAASTPIEEVLCGIWEQLLKRDQVGIHENFFDLGGHSLLATQVVSRVREGFSVELPLRVIFESPTITEISEAIEKAMRAEQGVELTPIVPTSRDRQLPLSFSQQRLWFIDRFEPQSNAYNVPASVRLKGQISVPALEKALSELIRRHETLRTVFAETEGLPVQVVMPATPLHLAITDIGDLSEAERLTEARRIVTEEALLPFDLSRGPLLRTGVVRLADDDHIVLFTMHHIVSDGWSIGVLIREIAALYTAFTHDEPSPLPELPIQYADFAAWQREWLQGEVLESELRYWRQALSGAPALLQLPTDRPRPAVQLTHGANHRILLSEELTADLKQLSRAEGVTLFMTLLAAFQTLLYRYSGQDDIVIGTPIAGRNRAEIEGLIGFFINTLVLRTKIPAQVSFRDLLKEVREVTLGAYTHQDLPFEKLVEELQPERDMGHTPLFQVMFALQSAPREDQKLEEVAMTNFTSQQTTAKFDLTLSLEEAGDRIAGSLEYNTDIFDAATIAKMVGYLQNIMKSIVTQPDTLIDNLELLSEQEQALVLEEISIEEFDESFSF